MCSGAPVPLPRPRLVPTGRDRRQTPEHPALALHLTATPGAAIWPGAAVGAHNPEILGDLLGLSDAELGALRDGGVI